MHNTQDPRRYITPYDFKVSEKLLGKALASPSKRLIGILLDLIVVGLIASLNGAILIGVTGVLSLAAGLQLVRRGNRMVAGVLLCTLALLCLIIVVAVTAVTEDSIVEMAGLDAVVEVRDDVEGATREEIKAADALVDAQAELAIANEQNGGVGQNWDLDSDETKPKSSDVLTPSVIDWLRGMFADLGISFGWAAVYFTVCVAWLNGQTVGKRIVGTRIIRIDGRDLSLWDSFGRYGGYGAGLATGLLGYMQVYWDVNRQAIQDKISETVVIDTRKPTLQERASPLEIPQAS
ncbi:hypothetical protein GCM10008090_01720 [Arenicella chitinivorans]|uniref:RDD domain-containing protein n=1 Tax=Arenicella chitinivorans TaxID=1329800 RepID=A0A918RFM5_9GAMM|nr:RDD family protein [Arenicella chitinivorans]GGZ97103.1 hypothetical protein GCM10008090_01720 [Arenicella chitinivorans]